MIYIFAAGILNNVDLIQIERQPGDKLIAADGGARHCFALNLIPDVVIGDFDSLNEMEITKLQQEGALLINYPEQKDSTDLELAIQYARQLQARNITVYGALGSRWDQSLANLTLLASPELEGVSIRLKDGTQEIFLIRSEALAEIHGKAGDTVSLIPIGGDAKGIVTHGLEYPLKDETLFLGKTRGVSNVLLDRKATISLQSGNLICVVIHQQ